MISRSLIAIVSLFLLSACSTTTPNGNDGEGGKITIAHLKSLCRGSSYGISEDYTIEGTLVANDWLGELNNSIIVVDESGGLEVAIECRTLSALLPVGNKVELFCNGLMLARIGGKIELGMAPQGDFSLGNIEEKMIGRYIRIVGQAEEYAPQNGNFSELQPSDIGNIFRFDRVRICDEERGLSWCDQADGEAVTTYRTFVDRQGVELAVRTLSTCKYAFEEIPTNEVSVVGVVDFSDNRYFLRIINKSVIW